METRSHKRIFWAPQMQEPVVVKTNDNEAMRVDADGKSESPPRLPLPNSTSSPRRE